MFAWCVPSSAVMKWSRKQLEERREVQKRRIQNPTGLRKGTVQHEKRWRPEGSLKINIDASAFEGD